MQFNIQIDSDLVYRRETTPKSSPKIELDIGLLYKDLIALRIIRYTDDGDNFETAAGIAVSRVVITPEITIKGLKDAFEKTVFTDALTVMSMFENGSLSQGISVHAPQITFTMDGIYYSLNSVQHPLKRLIQMFREIYKPKFCHALLGKCLRQKKISKPRVVEGWAPDIRTRINFLIGGDQHQYDSYLTAQPVLQGLLMKVEDDPAPASSSIYVSLSPAPTPPRVFLQLGQHIGIFTIGNFDPARMYPSFNADLHLWQLGGPGQMKLDHLSVKSLLMELYQFLTTFDPEKYYVFMVDSYDHPLVEIYKKHIGTYV